GDPAAEVHAVNAAESDQAEEPEDVGERFVLQGGSSVGGDQRFRPAPLPSPWPPPRPPPATSWCAMGRVTPRVLRPSPESSFILPPLAKAPGSSRRGAGAAGPELKWRQTG